MRLALIVEYEGTDYHGFQYQINAPSIQEELEKAIARFSGERIRVVGAGRTDAGVHAKGQVVAFNTEANYPPDTFARGLNFYLPEDIAISSAYQAVEGFDPRREAISRTYTYSIINRSAPSPLMRARAFLVETPLSVRRMQRASQFLVGKHDFARFSGPLEDEGASTVRQVYEASVHKLGEIVTFDVEGNAFLPRQVRRMTGSLVEIGRGTLSMNEFRRMIDGENSRKVANSLPPQGLCLMQVTYANFPPKVGELDGNWR